MNIGELVSILGLTLVNVGDNQCDISGGFTSDLLSDVMGKAKPNNVLITIQAHKNTIAVCSLIGIPAVIICSNRDIPKDMIDAAQEEGISICSTDLSQYEVSGKMWVALHP